MSGWGADERMGSGWVGQRMGGAADVTADERIDGAADRVADKRMGGAADVIADERMGSGWVG